MAFITYDEIVDNKLKNVGLSLDYVTKHVSDKHQDKLSFSIGEEKMGIALNTVAIIPRAEIDATGEECICFHNVYSLTLADKFDKYPLYNACYLYIADESGKDGQPGKKKKKKKQLHTGKQRGQYRLDPTNSYTPAQPRGDFFLNKITVRASDLSENTWSLLMRFMRERHNLKPSVAYTLADIPPATFHRIRNAQPKKETLLKLGVVLQLSVDEMVALLASAGFAFNPSDRRDLLIKGCFEEKIFNIFEITKALDYYNLEEMTFGNFDRLNPR